MAASMTVVTDNAFFDGGVYPDFVIQVDWISHTDGSVALGIVSTFAAAQLALSKGFVQPTRIQGRLVSVETAPGLNGDLATSLPTAYTLTLLDPHSLDLLDANGATRSASVAEQVVEDTPIKVDVSELTFTIASAGNGTKGRAYLHFMGA